MYLVMLTQGATDLPRNLRDIETCLRAHQSKLYHLGIRGNIARSTLAAGFARQHPHFYSHQRWQGARGQCARHPDTRSRQLLHHGSRLHCMRLAPPPVIRY